MKLKHTMAVVALLAGFVARGETVSFLLNGSRFVNREPGSYVVTTSDPAKIAQARAYLRESSHATFLLARVRIAAGGDGVNRNYAAPTQPAWDWHVVELIDWEVLDPLQPRAAVVITTRDGSVADVPAILRGDVTPAPVDPVTGVKLLIPQDTMGLINYTIEMELTPTRASRFSNVSQRGFVGTGERVLIAGFVIEGGVPRNVVVRALGPSLRAFGVTEALADPKIEVYRGAEKIGGNDNWADGSLNHPRVGPGPAAFIPPDAKEPAVQLSLAPGAYTVVVRGVNDGSGVALAEVFALEPVN